MSEATQDEVRIRRFLLGDVEEAEREQFEEQFLTDPIFREQVLMVESELIDEYADGELDQVDADKFKQYLALSPGQLGRVRLSQSIRNYARSELAAETPAPVVPLPDRDQAIDFGAPRRTKPYVYFAIAAALLLIVFGGIWLVLRLQSAQQLAREQSRRAEIEKQLAAANAAATGTAESPEPRVTPLLLGSVSTRSSGPQPVLSLTSGADAFDLWLLPTTTQYETYKASIKRVDSQDRFDVPGLKLTNLNQGRMVRLRLPASLFVSSLYEVTLTAIGPNGESVDAGTFVVQLV